MLDIQRIVADVVRPFGAGKYVQDWQVRAARAGALADYYSLRQADNPFFELDDDTLGVGFGADAILRQGVHQMFSAAFESTAISYAFPMYELAGDERQVFEAHYGGVDSVEKMALSAIAWAIVSLSPTRRDMLLLCGQLYEEGLHLKALSTLLGIDEAQQPWITAKREPFLTFARTADSIAEYAIVQNCLSEGEGALAAAEIQYALRALHRDSPPAQVARRITAEETHHALLGYLLVRQHDAYDEQFFNAVIGRYRTVEPLRPPETAKGRRQRFAVQLFQHYVKTRSVAKVEAVLVDAVDRLRRTGQLG
jgi:hypothetical protein